MDLLILDASYEWNHTMCDLMFSRFTQVVVWISASFFLWPTYIPCCTDRPRFVHSFICWWILGLFSLFGYCERSCNEHSCTGIFLNTCFQFCRSEYLGIELLLLSINLEVGLLAHMGILFNLLMNSSAAFAWTHVIEWSVHWSLPFSNPSRSLPAEVYRCHSTAYKLLIVPQYVKGQRATPQGFRQPA